MKKRQIRCSTKKKSAYTSINYRGTKCDTGPRWNNDDNKNSIPCIKKKVEQKNRMYESTIMKSTQSNPIQSNPTIIVFNCSCVCIVLIHPCLLLLRICPLRIKKLCKKKKNQAIKKIFSSRLPSHSISIMRE